MSKTLILVQLQRAESEARTLAGSLLKMTTDFQLVQVLKRAEIEHGYRAKQLQRDLDSSSGTQWKDQMFAEGRPTASQTQEKVQVADAIEAAEAAEQKLLQQYKMATELIRTKAIIDAAAEQQELYNQFAELKTQKTLQIKCLPPTDVCA